MLRGVGWRKEDLGLKGAGMAMVWDGNWVWADDLEWIGSGVDWIWNDWNWVGMGWD
jgi:hypothetical protein